MDFASRFFHWGLALIIAVTFGTEILGHEGHADGACSKLITLDQAQGDDELTIDLEEHALTALLAANPAENLAVQHPAIVMNAWQRVKSWVYAHGFRLMADPQYYGGMVRVFPVFSDGLPEAKGRRIIGQFRQIDTVVNYIDRGADGDGSTSKMLDLDGAPGTGKTEFLMILLELSRYLQSYRPEFFNYSYEFRNLSAIPELRPLLNVTPDEHGHNYEHPTPCPLGDSPIVLLPEKLQDQLVEMAAPAAEKLIRVKPTPHRPMCPHCHKITRAILKHYADKAGKRNLSQAEIVEHLNKHVVIKRRVIGRGGKLPKMNAEGKDVDYPGLFMAPNAFVLTQFGPDHPLSYFLNGKVLSAHGGILLLDEFWRNDMALRDMFLEVQENKIVTRGGAPSVPIDVVIIAASNTESLNAARANGQARAQVDRTRILPMYWDINPFLVAKTMLLKKKTGVLQQRLLTGATDGTTPSIVPANLDDLFPLPERDQPFVGPDRRFKLMVRSEDKHVHISPHTMLFMAQVTAATRLVTDAKQAEEAGNYKVTNSVAFRDLVTRLKILMRQYTVTPSEARELLELSILLKEGNAGISLRDAADNWLTEAISEAQKPGNGNCVTPIIAKRVLQRLLQDGAIQCPDNATRLKWLSIADTIAHHFLVPALQDDVNEAIGQDSGTADQIYDDLFAEIDALQMDGRAREYLGPNGETRLIDFERLAEIEKIYLDENRRPLARGEIIQWHARPAGARGEVRRHEGLMKSIRRYLAKISKRGIAFGAILKAVTTGEGDSPVKSKAEHAAHVMMHKLGYCERCLRSALELANQAEAATQPPGQPNQP